MKNPINVIVLTIIFSLLLVSTSCKKKVEPVTEPPKTPTKLPVTPTSPDQPTEITSVTNIVSGTKTGEVFLYGHLTRIKNQDNRQWYFTDDETTEIVLVFPSTTVPGFNVNILVYGGVEDVGNVDVFRWEEISTRPEEPVPPPNPEVPQPPTIVITTVFDITNNNFHGEALLAGKLTAHNDDDCDDDWLFDDGTATIEMDFPNCNVPNIGDLIYVYGYAGSTTEFDAKEWEKQ